MPYTQNYDDSSIKKVIRNRKRLQYYLVYVLPEEAYI